MVATLISLLVTLLVIGLIWWAVTTILGVIPVPEPIKTVVYVIMVVIVCLICIYTLLPLANIHIPIR